MTTPHGRASGQRVLLAFFGLLVLLGVWLLGFRGGDDVGGKVLEPSLAGGTLEPSVRQQPLLVVEATREPDSLPESSVREQLPGPVVAAAPAEQQPEAPPEPVLEGVVLDAAFRKPIVGAKIEMGGFGERLATTDGEGRFELEYENGELFLFSVTAPGFLNETFGGWLESRGRDGDAYVFLLHPSGRIEGTVTDSNGEPVTSGRVFLLDSNSTHVPHHGPPEKPYYVEPRSGTIAEALDGFRPVFHQLALAPSSQLDEDGHYLLDSLLGHAAGGPRSMCVIIDSDEVVLTASEPFGVAAGETKTVDLQVDRASRVEGTLIFPKGIDRPHHQLWFCWHTGHMDTLGGHSGGYRSLDRLVQADADGHFNSGPLWPVERLKIVAVFPPLGMRGVPSSRIIYDWELELPEDTVLEVELAPGDDVRYPLE